MSFSNLHAPLDFDDWHSSCIETMGFLNPFFAANDMKEFGSRRRIRALFNLVQTAQSSHFYVTSRQYWNFKPSFVS